jgi:hypothetical protein
MSCVCVTKIASGLKSYIGNLFKNVRPSFQGEDSTDQLPKATNPWQEELDRLLVNDVKHPEMRISGHAASVAQQNAYKKNKPKRPADATVKDLKTWWSGSIATWESGVDKPSDPNGQKSRHNASTRWFQ